MQWIQDSNQKESCIGTWNGLYESQKHNVEWKKVRIEECTLILLACIQNQHSSLVIKETVVITSGRCWLGGGTRELTGDGNTQHHHPDMITQVTSTCNIYGVPYWRRMYFIVHNLYINRRTGRWRGEEKERKWKH